MVNEVVNRQDERPALDARRQPTESVNQVTAQTFDVHRQTGELPESAADIAVTGDRRLELLESGWQGRQHNSAPGENDVLMLVARACQPAQQAFAVNTS